MHSLYRTFFLLSLVEYLRFQVLAPTARTRFTTYTAWEPMKMHFLEEPVRLPIVAAHRQKRIYC